MPGTRIAVARGMRAVLAATLAVFAFGAEAGWTAPAILALALCLATAEAIEAPSASAILPGLVTTGELPTAVAVVATFRNVAWAIGPVAGGILIARHGVAAAYAAASLLVAASALLLGLLPRTAERARARQDVSWAAVREGVGFVRRERAILGSITLDLFAVIFASVDALLPVFARDVLEVGPEGHGWLAAATMIGTFAMSLVLIARPPLERPGRALLAAVAVFGLATLAFAASGAFWLSMAALVAAGMADQVSMVTRSTILQLATPDPLRGRVNAVNQVFLSASNELGRAESGFVAAWLGAVGSVWLGGGLCLAALGAVGLGMPELARYRVPGAEAEAD